MHNYLGIDLGTYGPVRALPEPPPPRPKRCHELPASFVRSDLTCEALVAVFPTASTIRVSLDLPPIGDVWWWQGRVGHPNVVIISTRGTRLRVIHQVVAVSRSDCLERLRWALVLERHADATVVVPVIGSRVDLLAALYLYAIVSFHTKSRLSYEESFQEKSFRYYLRSCPWRAP